jgi:hypothetical protein
MLFTHYKIFKAHFGNRAQLCFTDTDSLIYKLECLNHETPIDQEFFDINEDKCPHLNDALEVFRAENPEGASGIFDLSALNISGRSCPNKKLLGTMKDETGFKRITELLTPLPKQYLIETIILPEEEAFVPEAERKDLIVRKGKGIPKKALKDLRAAQYKEVIYGGGTQDVEFNCMRSQRHEVKHMTMTKTGLASDNGKVFQLGPFASRPLGHFRNVNEPEDCDYDEPWKLV